MSLQQHRAVGPVPVPKKPTAAGWRGEIHCEHVLREIVSDGNVTIAERSDRDRDGVVRGANTSVDSFTLAIKVADRLTQG